MYYEPGKTPHGLPHDPFKSCVVPRPIGWISTVDAQGRHNLAPYSQFQNVTFDPPIVMFSANQSTQGERRAGRFARQDPGRHPRPLIHPTHDPHERLPAPARRATLHPV
jgi:hypothetical protein